MSDKTLFESGDTTTSGGQEPVVENQQAAAPTQQTQQSQPSGEPKDLLGLINGMAGTNYDSFDKLGGGLKAKEDYIRKLEAENSSYREQLEKVATLEEKLSKMTEVNTGTQQSAPAIDEQSIARMLDSTLQQREAAQRAQANELAVSKALQDKYGDKAGEMLKAKANEMGVDMAFMQSVAQKSPKAIMAYFGESAPKVPGVHTSSVQTSAQTQQQTQGFKPYSPNDVKTTRDLKQRFLELTQEIAGDENPFASQKKSNSWY